MLYAPGVFCDRCPEIRREVVAPSFGLDGISSEMVSCSARILPAVPAPRLNGSEEMYNPGGGGCVRWIGVHQVVSHREPGYHVGVFKVKKILLRAIYPVMISPQKIGVFPQDIIRDYRRRVCGKSGIKIIRHRGDIG